MDFSTTLGEPINEGIPTMRTPLQLMILRTFETDAQNMDTHLTSRLNPKISPIGGDYGRVRSSGSRNHQGWDLSAPMGTPVFAITDGIVEWTRMWTGNRNDLYGNQVCLRTNLKRKATGEPIWAFYAHLDKITVRANTEVREGDVIGQVGQTGNAGKTPSHLHFEIRSSGGHLGKGLLYRLHPGEVLGYSYYKCG
jgi:murein DD-endopeptidase MepM/ murein hydrolase activator NlpD